MTHTSRSAAPGRRHAVDRELERESVFDWLRRQRRADRKPIPPRGITQAAPKRSTPVAPDADLKTQRNE